jgi:RimJ/RimL family protein N-acetyltransferase
LIPSTPPLKYFRFAKFMMKPERILRADKSGKSFEIGVGCAEDFPPVLEMYRVFSPKAASQGLPPEDAETCHNWLKDLFKIGKNLLAWRGETVIGHAVSIPDPNGKSGEFVIFVDQDNRNIGIGTELTRFALEKSRVLGLDSVWLTVNVSNYAAIKLYKKLGFEYCDMDKHERVMRIKLRLQEPTKD